MLPGAGQAADDPSLKQQRDGSLGRLGKLVYEQCFAYYSRRAKEVADRMAQLRMQGPLAPELAARLAFKVCCRPEGHTAGCRMVQPMHGLRGPTYRQAAFVQDTLRDRAAV